MIGYVAARVPGINCSYFVSRSLCDACVVHLPLSLALAMCWQRLHAVSASRPPLKYNRRLLSNVLHL